MVWRGARRLQKLFFAFAGCRRESALESRHEFTLGRRVRIVTALCAEFHDRWNVSWYRFLCVRVTRLVCVRQARVAPISLAYVTCLAAQNCQEFRSCGSRFSRKPRVFDPVLSLRGGRWHRLPRSQSLHGLRALCVAALPCCTDKSERCVATTGQPDGVW